MRYVFAIALVIVGASLFAAPPDELPYRIIGGNGKILDSGTMKKVPAPADGGPPIIPENTPWLTSLEQAYMKSLWPEGVPFPPELKFYKLPKASQRLATTDGRPSFGFYATNYGAGNINRDFPYIGSGGMDFAKPGTWRNVTGLSLPKGSKIIVWSQHKPVWNGSSYQHEVALFWAFPVGTQAFDVLIRRNDDGSEHIFTVRRRTKIDAEKWDDGTHFFPAVEGGKEWTTETVGNHHSQRALGVPKITYRCQTVAPITGKPKFAEQSTRVALEDGGHFMPPGFQGTGMSCTKCHGVVSLSNCLGNGREPAPYAGPELRGRDTIFSWMPARVDRIATRDFGEYTPTLDYRWPLDVRQR